MRAVEFDGRFNSGRPATGLIVTTGLQHADVSNVHRLVAEQFNCRVNFMPKSPSYWLFKTEPNVYSIDDLANEKKQTTTWEGVRNYQVRNMLRDDIKSGDGVLFYHSRIEPMCIAGTARVVMEGYPDHFAFESDHKYFDAKSDPDNPRWYMVDVQLIQKFDTPVTRDMLRDGKGTTEMKVMAKGSRLSITPVTAAEWKAVHRLAGAKLQNP